MGQIRGLFRSDFKSDLKKAPDLSHLGPIWPTLEPNLPSLPSEAQVEVYCPTAVYSPNYIVCGIKEQFPKRFYWTACRHSRAHVLCDVLCYSYMCCVRYCVTSYTCMWDIVLRHICAVWEIVLLLIHVCEIYCYFINTLLATKVRTLDTQCDESMNLSVNVWYNFIYPFYQTFYTRI